MNGSNSIWIRMDHGVLARRNSGGLSGESPLIRAAPQKLLSLRRPWAVLVVVYQIGPSVPPHLDVPDLSTPLSRPVVDPPCFRGTGASLAFLSPIRAYLLVVR